MSFPEKLRSRWASIRARWTEEYAFPVIIALATGLLTLVLGYCFSWTFSNEWPTSFAEIWVRWDSAHYLAIAAHGYSAEPSRRFLICFFPLYPLLIDAVACLVRDPFVAALLVSNLAFAGALVLLQKLVALDFDRRVARLAVVFCAFFPTAYFFHLIYTEGLFLFFSLGTLYLSRRGRWWEAGAVAMLAAYTRLPGAVLAPVLLLEYLHQRNFQWRAIRVDVLSVALPGVSVLAYLALNQRVFGDPFAFLAIQKSVFFRTFASPLAGWDYDYHALLTRTVSERFMFSGLQMFCFLATIPLLVWSARRLRPSYTLYTALLWILTFCYSFWMSVPRFVMMFLPFYIAIALAANRSPAFRYVLLFTSVLLYSFGMTLFSLGRWAH